MFYLSGVWGARVETHEMHYQILPMTGTPTLWMLSSLKISQMECQNQKIVLVKIAPKPIAVTKVIVTN